MIEVLRRFLIQVEAEAFIRRQAIKSAIEAVDVGPSGGCVALTVLGSTMVRVGSI